MRVPAQLMIAVMLAFSMRLCAQRTAPVEGSISPAEILQKFVAATGGLEAHEKLHSLAAEGMFGLSLDHPLGNYSFSYKAPSSDLLELDLISHGTSWVGRRDDQLLRRTTVEGVGMLNGAGIDIVEQDWRSLVEWDFSRDYSKIELIGVARVANRWAYGLLFTPRRGDRVLRYYDQENFLLVRMDQVQRFRPSKDLPEVVYSVESYFRDYTERDGLKFPRLIDVNRTEGELEFSITKIRPNAKIDDALFTHFLARR